MSAIGYLLVEAALLLSVVWRPSQHTKLLKPFLFATLLFLLETLADMVVMICQEALVEWFFLRMMSLQTVYAVLLLRSRNLLFMAGRIFLESLLKRTFLVTTMLLFLMMLLVLAATLLLPLLPFLVAILFTTMTRSDEGLF